MRKRPYHCLLSLLSVIFFLSFHVNALAASLQHNQSSLQQDPLKSEEDYCTPSGTISDACCDYETVEQINKDIHLRLNHLIKTDFFKYYKLNLFKECPFWAEDGQCMNQACSVETTDETNVPENFRSHILGAIQTSAAGALFQPFKRCEFTDQDFCVVEDEADVEGVFVNLQENPERFTGYAGTSAGRVWKSIYDENCFNAANHMDPSRRKNLPLVSRNHLFNLKGPGMESDVDENEELCFEKRVYYRLISGLHSSISIHICDEYLNQTTGEWGPNLDCFISRVGSHKERIQNVYFNYVVLLRAISKMSEYLRDYEFCTGDRAGDNKVKEMVNELVNTVKSCPGTFDEKLMFASSDSRLLKEEFKVRFRNVSRIMDCVGCDKCRLWGKLQVSGVGTALKVLFSYDDKFFNPKVHPNLLTRTEIVALFNTFNRFSESISAIERFRGMYKELIRESKREHSMRRNDSKLDDDIPATSPSAANPTLQNLSSSDTDRYCSLHPFDFLRSFRDVFVPYAEQISSLVIRQLEHWQIPVPFGLRSKPV